MNAYVVHEPPADTKGSEQGAWYAGKERRRSRRMALHWTLYLACAGSGQPLRTKTKDISRDGFYCHLERPVRPGDEFECDIVVPTHNSQNPQDVVYLRCHAQAMRVEKLGSGSEFGLACRIEDYRLIRDRENHSWVHDADKILQVRLEGSLPMLSRVETA